MSSDRTASASLTRAPRSPSEDLSEWYPDQPRQLPERGLTRRRQRRGLPVALVRDRRGEIEQLSIAQASHARGYRGAELALERFEPFIAQLEGTIWPEIAGERLPPSPGEPGRTRAIGRFEHESLMFMSERPITDS
jgi:hypothetical protein